MNEPALTERIELALAELEGLANANLNKYERENYEAAMSVLATALNDDEAKPSYYADLPKQQ